MGVTLELGVRVCVVSNEHGDIAMKFMPGNWTLADDLSIYERVLPIGSQRTKYRER